MKILEVIASKANEIGTEKLLQALGVEITTYSSWFYKGKRFKAPSYEICQKVLDLWGEATPAGHVPELNATKELSLSLSDIIQDGSHASLEDGIVHTTIKVERETANWESKDVCLCFPVYDRPCYEYFYTILALVAKYRDQVWLNGRGSDSMIARSRNHLAKRFLDTKATWSIWFDSDMCFPMGHAGVYSTLSGMTKAPADMLGLHTIDRLLSWKKSIVGGCYWDRSGRGKLIAGSSMPILNSIPSNTLNAVDFVGTGCLAVHRQVFLDIAEKFPETMSPDSLGNECGFFTPMNTDKRMLGEDEAFAKRAANAGHPSYLDLGILCGHIGTAVHGLPETGSKI